MLALKWFGSAQCLATSPRNKQFVNGFMKMSQNASLSETNDYQLFCTVVQ